MYEIKLLLSELCAESGFLFGIQDAVQVNPYLGFNLGYRIYVRQATLI